MIYPEATAPLAGTNPLFGLGPGLGASGGTANKAPPHVPGVNLIWSNGNLFLSSDTNTIITG